MYLHVQPEKASVSSQLLQPERPLVDPTAVHFNARVRALHHHHHQLGQAQPTHHQPYTTSDDCSTNGLISCHPQRPAGCPHPQAHVHLHQHVLPDLPTLAPNPRSEPQPCLPSAFQPDPGPSPQVLASSTRSIRLLVQISSASHPVPTSAPTEAESRRDVRTPQPQAQAHGLALHPQPSHPNTQKRGGLQHRVSSVGLSVLAPPSISTSSTLGGGAAGGVKGYLRLRARVPLPEPQTTCPPTSREVG